MRGKSRVQWLQPPTGAADPARQVRAFDPGAIPGEDLSLSIERGVVAVLADQHLSDQPRCRQALGDQTIGRRRLMDRATGAAAVLGAANAQDA